MGNGQPIPVIYVAGPFRSRRVPYSYWEQCQFVRRAEEIALKLWQAGAAALCPHLNTANFQGAAPDHIWLDGDLELLRRCDAVVMVPGWHESSGAKAERDEALARSIPVYYAEHWAEVEAFIQRYRTYWEKPHVAHA